MPPYRFAVIGCGRMGLAHSRRLANDRRAELVSFYDFRVETAERLRDQIAPAARVHQSLPDFFAENDVDAVVICTPTTTHYDLVCLAAHNGCHVMCEKPLATSSAEIDELIALAESRADQHFLLAYQRRFHAPYRCLREAIQSGRYGAIQSVVSINAERWQQTIHGTWRDVPGINVGGFLGDAGSHKMDALFFVTGLVPIQVFATSQFCGSRVEILSSVSATLSGDVPLTMAFTGNAHSFQEELFVHCEEADLILRDGILWVGRNNKVTAIETPPDEWGPESRTNPVTGILDLLDGQATNPAPFTCARPVYDFMQAVRRSRREGRLISLPDE